LNSVEVEVFLLADYQLHGADDMVGGGITHGCVPIVFVENLEIPIGPREMDCIVLVWLKERAEDQGRVLLLFGRKAVERVKRIVGNGLRKSQCRLHALIFDEVELHDAWNGLLSALCAILAAVFRLRHIMPHDMGIDHTALSFSSSFSRASLMDEEEDWLLICVLGSSHGMRFKVD
jgi:hypothetical protein